MDQERKQQLFKELHELVEEEPHESETIIKIALSSLATFEQRIREDRDLKGANSLSLILPWVFETRVAKLKAHALPFFVDAFFLVFPKGHPDMHSPANLDAFKTFRELCIKSDVIKQEWLQDRGELYNWMQKVIA